MQLVINRKIKSQNFMKTVILFLALIFSFAVNAQEIKPNFEKEGNLVKATYFHANGEVAQTGYFLKGKLHGEWVMYNEEGQKMVAGSYTNGLKNGKWVYNEGEELREVAFINNRIESVVKKENPDAVVYTK